MSWCPKCKIEYVSSIEHCNECGSKLVEFITEDENTKCEGEPDKSIVKTIKSKVFFSGDNKIALTIKILAVIFLVLGFSFSIYISIDYWYKLKDYGQMANNRGVPFQQFITMFGRCVVSSIVIFALGEGLQILHDIRRKIYDK